jgi:uncharacterized protein
MKFLSARWEHLLFANYVVSPELLAPYVPPKTCLDTFDGNCFVSLVAFWFNETKVLGLKVPFHTRFEEVNLRFYVTPENDHSRRGVTFIKEIVPLRVIPWVANTLFHENYVCTPMRHQHLSPCFSYSWKERQQHSFHITLESDLTLPMPGSVEEFITEHYWGYAGNQQRTLEYHVEHPPWPSANIHNFEISIDYAINYGDRFACLNKQQPHSVLYAAGSEVSVFFPRRL